MQPNHSANENTSPDPAQTPGGGPESIEQDPAQMPLSMATGSEDQLLGLEEDNNSFGQDKGVNGFLLILLLLVIGGGTLWVMRMSGAMEPSDPDLASAEQKIDQALQRFRQDAEAKQPFEKLFEDTNDAIAVFANDPVNNQINLDNVQKNPFELSSDEQKTVEADDSNQLSEEARKKQAREMRLKELRRKAEQLKLQSLLSGKNSMAVISGDVVGEGDTVGPFTVSAISPYGVRLKAEGETFTLRIAPSNNSNPSQRRRR